MIRYEALDFYMLRVPILSVNDYKYMFGDDNHLLKEKLYKAYLSDDFLKESLHVASDDLYKATSRTREMDNSKSVEQVTSSLAKYYIRTSSRPTPFGLFSGISFGSFSDETCAPILKKDKYVKRARVDMEWVYGVIKMLEDDPNVVPWLGVRFNDSIVEKGNRLEIPNNTFLQNSENTEKGISSIRFTEPVKYIKETCNNFKKLNQLAYELSNFYTDVESPKIHLFLKQLLNNEYLLSELRPPLCDTDPLNYMINVLLSCNTRTSLLYAEALSEVQNMINQYNCMKLGSGDNQYNNIVKKMQELYKCKNYIQVDLKVAASNNTLSHQKKKELEDFISTMDQLCVEYKQCNEMLEYINEFLEKYGFYAEVCVTDLLDPDKGLGVPKHYRTNSPSFQKSSQGKCLEDFLEKKMLNAIKQKQKCIEITEYDINSLCANMETKEHFNMVGSLSSFELYLLVHNSKNDRYSFTLAPTVGSDGAGKTFGRFADMLADDERKLLENASKKEENLMPDHLLVEIMEIPSKGRTNNITLNNSNRDYQVALNSNYSDGKIRVSVSDLYIGVDRHSHQFYIKSKKYNKRVIVGMTNMLNPTIGSVTSRFLRDISSSKKYNLVNTIRNIAWGNKSYTPRIVYKSIIIKPETWVLTKSDLGNLSEGASEEIERAILEYFKKWDVPRYVYLTVNDNRILLDLNCKLHIKEIINELKTDGSVKLVENTIDFNDHFSRDENGNAYVSEIVVPFLFRGVSPNGVRYDEKKEPLYTCSNIGYNKTHVNPSEQILLPGVENWLYFKLYGNSTRQNELLSLLYDELEKIKSEGLIDQYFFIRYSDPKPHIRMRIQAADNCVEKLFGHANRLFVNLREWGLLSSAVVDSYQRETERYGGPDLIREVEKYFFEESRFIMKVLKAKRFLHADIDEDLLVMSFLSGALDMFGLSLEEKVQYMDWYKANEEYRKNFQKNRNQVMKAVDTSDDWKRAREGTGFTEVYDWLNELLFALEELAVKISSTDNEGNLTNTQREIVASIIHMFCNRLFANTTRERKNYIISRHGLYALNQQKKHFAG